MNTGYLFAIVLLFNLVFSQIAHGQDSRNIPEGLITPPFIARTSNFMMLAFHLDKVEAQKLLPDDIMAKQDENGFVNGNLEIYETDQTYGIANYTIAFFTIHVTAGQTNLGKEGNWAVWGVINNQASLTSFKHFYNFPYKKVKHASIKSTDMIYKADIGEQDGEGLQLLLKKNVTLPVRAEGLAVILSQSNESDVIEIEIPWLAEGHQTEVLSFTINAGNNKILKILQNASPYYSQVSSNIFSYSKPSK